jgi:RNase H-fold protein (predicted Holliday junction resolvase)
VADISEKTVVIAIDPGTHKCGMAHLDWHGDVISREIIERDKLIEGLKSRRTEYPDSVIVVGGATQGRAVAGEITEVLGIPVEIVDEANTTDEARELFWRENRPGCFLGIFPASFRPMPRPVDDYAAVIIGRRFLEQLKR